MSNVVETVTIRYQQEGGAELKRMAESLARAQETVAKFTKDQTSAGSASSLQLGAWGKSYQNFQARVEGVSKATRQAYSDLRALTQGMKAGVGDQAEFARGLERIKQNLTAMGTATGRDFGMAADISKRMNIGAVGTDAREAAKVFEASFARIEAESKATAEAIRRNFGEAFNIRMNIGSSARELGATTSALEKLSEKLDLIEGGRSARVGQGINERLGINSATAQQLGATTSALADLARQLDVVDAARTANFGEQLNARFNIGGPGAKDMGGTVSALMESEKAAQKFEQRLERIIAEIDPVTTAQKRYNTELAEYQALADKGYLSSTQLGQAQQVAAQRFEYTSRALEGVGSATKLGVQDMQNLQFQLNDIAVSLASGQSPFTVLMQQGAQMTQVFGPGASVGGALKSVGGAIKEFVLNPLNLAVLGFAAAAGAVALIYNAVQSKFPPIEDRIERQTKAVEELAKRYNMAAVAATGYADKSASRLAAVSEADFAKDLAAYKARADKMAEYIRGVALTAMPQTDMLGSFFGGADMKFPQIADLMAGFNKSDPQAVQRLLDGLAELSRASTDPAFKEFARQIEADYAAVAELGARLKGTNEILDATSKRITALAAEFKTAMGVLTGMGPAATTEMQRLDAAFARAADSAQSLGEIDAAAKAYQRALDDMNRDSANTVREMQGQFDDLNIAPSGREIAEIKRRYDQEIADSARLQGSTTIRQNLEKARDLEILAVKEQLRREDTARREGFELDMRAIIARTAAEKASIEAERVRIGLRAEGEDPGVIEQRAAEAAALSRAQSEHALAESLRSRNLAEEQAIGSLKLQIDSLGLSAGASAEAAEKFRLLAEYKEAAYQEGRDSLTAAETQRIEEQAKAVGALNQALAEQTLKQEILDERKMIGLSDKEREVQERLQAAGIDATSANGEYLASQLRVNDALQESADRARDFVETLVDGLTSGKGLLDSLAGAFGGFAKSLASAGLDKLMGGLLGGQSSVAGGGVSGGGAIGVLGALAGGLQKLATPTATQAFAAGSGGTGFGQTYAAAPTIAVTRAALPPLGAASSSVSALVPAIGRASTNIEAAARAIRTIESGSAGGNYNAIGPATKSGDRAYGAYQIMGANISSWTKAALGQSLTIKEFLGNQAAQDQTWKHRFVDIYAAKYGMEGASRAWFAGEGGMKNYKAQDVVGTSVSGYGSRFGQLYSKSGGTNGSVAAVNALGAQAVSDGVTDFARKSATGSVPSLLSGASAPAQAAMADGGFDGFSHAGGAAAGITKGLSGLQAGMSALSAGIGVAANAYQSGDPLGGAVSGALSGYSLGASIGAIGGPLGALAGAAIGGIAGLFGKSKQKKEAEKAKKDAENQKALEASRAWISNLPQFEQLMDVVGRQQRGSIGAQIKELESSLAQFEAIANESKNSVAISQVQAVRKQIAVYGDLLKELFRDTLDPVVEDLAAGFGLDTPFTKARDGVRKTADAYRGFIDDVRQAYSYDTTKIDTLKAEHDSAVQAIEAAKTSQLSALTAQNLKTVQAGTTQDMGRTSGGIEGRMAMQRAASGMSKISEEQEAEYAKQIAEAGTERDEAIAAYEAQIAEVKAKYDDAVSRAILAAREGLLRIVSGDVREQSAIEQALAEARGAAAGLDLALQDLGMSAEEASTAIETAIGKRKELLARDFTEGLTDQIADLDGKGYLADLRELTKSIETMMRDANLLNVDTSLVDTFFSKQAQSIVDGFELTGDAFAELIAAFPQLSGAVHEFAGDLEAAAEEAKALSESVAANYASFLNSRLSDAMAERAQAESDLLSRYQATVSFVKSIRDQLRQMEMSDGSPFGGREKVDTARARFNELAAKAMTGDVTAQDELVGASQELLDASRAYYVSSEAYFSDFALVKTTLQATDAKTSSQLDTLRAQNTFLQNIDTNTKSLTELMAALSVAIANQGTIQKQVDAGRSFGANPERNRLIDQGVASLGLTYTGDHGFTADGGTPFLDWKNSLPADQKAAVEGVIGQYIGINRQKGGLIPGYQAGGIVGNGIWNQDSVLARYAGGGSIGLAGGEMVISAPRVTPQTYPVLDQINRTGRVPGNEGMRLDRVERLLEVLVTTTGGGLAQNTEAVERGNRSSEMTALASRRATSNKQAA